MPTSSSSRVTTLTALAVGALVAVGGCGAQTTHESSAPNQTSATSGGSVTPTDPTDPSTSGSTHTSGASATRPMSSIPPPTMTRPTAPPTSPSDQVKPQTLVGAATRTEQGCLILTTDVGSYELVGDLAPSALVHPRVRVTGMPHPELRGACDHIVVEVVEVAATT